MPITRNEQDLQGLVRDLNPGPLIICSKYDKVKQQHFDLITGNNLCNKRCPGLLSVVNTTCELEKTLKSKFPLRICLKAKLLRLCFSK